MRADSEGAVQHCGSIGEQGAFTASLAFDLSSAFFAGHFPGRPLVPGVVWIEAARVVLERASGCPYRLLGVRRAKFSRPVGPGEAVTLLGRLCSGATLTLQASMSCGDQPVAKVVLLLQEA